MKNPEISVVMATYNHASFVREAMTSVLEQEGVDIEFIIADDGSTDSTRDVVAEVRDSRISFFPYEVNRGACVVTNELIGRARGKYIALINSDDAWVEGKLKYQYDFMESEPGIGAVFGRARFVDRHGALIDKRTLPFGSVFDQDNRTSGQWVRRFFSEGNCICHPTMLIHRALYEDLGKYSNRFRQLPDLDMWVRLVKKYEIHVSDRELINFRILPGENASSHTTENAIRTINEHFLIAETALVGISAKRLIEGFGDILVVKDVPTNVHLDIEKTLLYFHQNQWLWRPYKLIGLLKMRELLESAAHRRILADEYGISDRWFQNEMSSIDVLMPHHVADSFQHHTKGALRAAWRGVFKGGPTR